MPEAAMKVGTGTVDIMGAKVEFLECSAEKHPLGLQVQFFAPGGIAPVNSGSMEAGSALLYLPPHVAEKFKANLRVHKPA